MKLSNAFFLLNIILDSGMTVINYQNNNYFFVADIFLVIFFSILIIINSK